MSSSLAGRSGIDPGLACGSWSTLPAAAPPISIYSAGK
ncbi:hypothetical protein BIWAKO_00730 [Bosea sp. BIWAKO-01]|nr:hypothetical protein BIWAKO_00730 [Bosea sp. BIWAKO-01]